MSRLVPTFHGRSRVWIPRPNYVGGSAAASAAVQYWASSARRMGLVDGSDGKSIVFHDPREEAEEVKLISDEEMN